MPEACNFIKKETLAQVLLEMEHWEMKHLTQEDLEMEHRVKKGYFRNPENCLQSNKKLLI